MRVLKVGKKFHVWQYSNQGVFRTDEYLLSLYHFLQNQSQCGLVPWTRTLFQDGCPSTNGRGMMEELVLCYAGCITRVSCASESHVICRGVSYTCKTHGSSNQNYWHTLECSAKTHRGSLRLIPLQPRSWLGLRYSGKVQGKDYLICKLV